MRKIRVSPIVLPPIILNNIKTMLPENKSNQLVVITLDEQRYALYLSVVERVVRMVQITPLPKAPEIVLGVISDLRRIFSWEDYWR